ncbi:PAS domain-containing sensor histidine kinase [Undibacterium sp. Ji50W]|uniref:PAS domain-containing sensor histidine kinase n=1 Tax=Undibacterium sp. Ji50W TaxID=3413041 RepID=UPI003BEF75D1
MVPTNSNDATPPDRHDDVTADTSSLLASIVNSSDDAIIASNLEGKIISWNRAASRIFGYPLADVLDQPFALLFPEGQLPDLATLVKLLQQGTPIGQFETIRRCLGGNELPTLLTISPVCDHQDILRGLSMIVRDFSEGYRIATRLTQSERHFRQVVDAAPNAMVMIDGRGCIEMVNTQTEIIFGYNRTELLGKTMELLIPERFRKHHPGLRQDYFAVPTTRAMGSGRDLYGLRKDGSEFPVEIGLNPIETTDGIKVLSAIVDISERKRQEERFRLVVEAAPNAMVMIDSRGYMEMVNAQTEQLFGYAREELLGKPMEILIPERFRPQHPGLRSSYFATPSTRAMGGGRDLFGLRKDGSEFQVEIGLNPIHTAEGIKVLSAIVDISERKRFTDELSRRNQELNNFAYVASHDLKSPLRGVDQLATWLSEDLVGKIDADTDEHLRLMRIRIKRMERLLDDLLLYFRAGQLGGTIEHVDFAALVRDVFELCCAERPFNLELDGNFPICPTHKVPLELVFRNLISNALKHHDQASGKIHIRASHTEHFFEFAVADDGPGIAEEHRERVFTMFQTLRPRDEVEGSGMGLAIIKKTIESLGGSIRLDGNHPRGAVFHFSWPRQVSRQLS